MDEEFLILAELDDLSPIFSPLKTTNRIKYTCFNVSVNFLVFGATSGGLYVFRREPCVFLQLLPSREGSVTNLAISPDEKFIAFSTIKGVVCVLERSSSHGAKQIVSSCEHQGAQVTNLQWNESNDEVYVGDDAGKVSIIAVSLFPAKNMFQNPSFVLMQLDSKIVQMDFCSDMLLVSTLTKCYICDTAKELFRQVGHKLRDGEYGACIYNTQRDKGLIRDGGRMRDRVGFSLDSTDKTALDYSNLKHLKLFCARPGSRLWEVSIDGTVISTHHFKEALAVAPRNIIFQETSTSQDSDLNNYSAVTNRSYACNEQNTNSNYLEQSFNFPKLYIVLSKYLFTFKRDGIYIFDPEKGAVLLWNNEIADIVDVRCINDIVYIWSNYARMIALNLVPLEKFLVRLYFRKKYLQLGRLCLEYSDLVRESADNSGKLYLLHDLIDKLKESQANENIGHLCDSLEPLLEVIKKNFQQRQVQVAEKLKSGIYVINNREETFLNSGDRQRPRPNYLHLKTRSHSVSPDRIAKAALKHQGSTSSLPDMAKEGDKAAAPPEARVPEESESASLAEMAKICHELKGGLSKEVVFRFLDAVLRVGGSEDADFESVRAVPFETYVDSDSARLASEAYHEALGSKTLFEWLKQYEAIDLKMYNKFMLNNCSIQSLSTDYKFSKVLTLFSSVADKKKTFEALKSLDCYYLSLVKVLQVFEEDANVSTVAEASLRLTNETSPVNVLNVAYYLIRKGEIGKCVRYSNKIGLADFLYLIFRYQDESNGLLGQSYLKDLQAQNMFLSYLDGSLNRGDLILGSNALVESYIVSALQSASSSAKSPAPNCSCGFPPPGRGKHSTPFSDIAYSLVEKTWPADPVKCVAMCEKVPCLWKSLLLLRKDEPILTLLPLILQLGDLAELESRFSEMDVKMFEICVRHLIGLKNGNCLNCGSKIGTENGTASWSELGMLCVKSVGPQETLRLFGKYAADITDLDQAFYQAIIFSAIMEKHSKGLRKNIVDLLNGKDEREGNCLKAFSDEIRSDLFPEDAIDRSAPSTSSHCWGVKVDVKSPCAICSLSLDSKVLLSEAGLVMFKCSHAFHSVCIRKADAGCPICN